jgi:parallel beta-helix repeat protein
MKRHKNYKLSSVLITMALVTLACGKTIYVDDDATGANDGSSWMNAYVYLQDALADAETAEKPVEIRVAQGIYKPDGGIVAVTEFDLRTLSFQLINGVTLAGGYAGLGESDPNARDIELYTTTLSGDIGTQGDSGDNSYHVVESSNKDETTVLDGFTITGGHYFLSSGTMPINPKIGTGMYNDGGNPTIINCTFSGNFTDGNGGGMYNNNSSPIVTNCTFIGNSSPEGGGMYNYNSSPTLTNCTFTGNFGDGIFNRDSSPTLTNCTFTGNSLGGMFNWYSSSPTLTNCTFIRNSSVYGGGMCNSQSSSPIVTNCTLIGNSAIDGGGISNSVASNPILTSCIIRNNAPDQIDGDATVTYSNIQGGWDGVGNIDEDPLFAEPGYWADVNDPNILVEPEDLQQGIPDMINAVWVDGDYHLKSLTGRFDPNSESWVLDDESSPCIDAGDPNTPVGDEPEPNGGRINMGAYGGTAEASKSGHDETLLRIAYIYYNDLTVAESFQSMLESHGCPTSLIKSNDVTATLLDSIDLIIVADDYFHAGASTNPIGTGSLIATIEDSGKPVLGLGDGGYDFFGELDLSIGNPYGGHSSKNGIRVIDPENSLFSTPYPIEIPDDNILQLYVETSSIGIYLWPDVPETVTVIGSEPDDAGYYPLLMEHNRYLLWGFDESPQKMTDVGKRLFINVVIWAANAAWESEI